ncbi:MAG: hypothetical protein J4F31_12580, partial [Flavobacteriales bacterium]|nr:hypothetical protein [Flavobacteriales bacterium]
ADMTVLDIVLHDELRDDFAKECENLLLFDAVYDHIVANLASIAREAESSRALSRESLKRLIEAALAQAGNGSSENDAARLRSQFFDWYQRTAAQPRSARFFRAVEEWKKNASSHISDT